MNKKLLYLVLLVALTVGIRVLYAWNRPMPILSSDGVGYYSLGNRTLENPTFSTIVNQYRTPLYPLLLSGVVSLTGHAFVLVDTSEFYESSKWIVLIQSLSGVSAIMALYVLLLRLRVPAVWAFGAGILVGLNISLFSWDWIIGTESLAASIGIWLTYVVVTLMQKPTVRGYIILFILSTVAWLLRPNMLAMSVVAFCVLFYGHGTRKYRVLTLIMFCITVSLPLVYMKANAVLHGYNGISQILDINLLGQVLVLDLPIEAAKEYTLYYQPLLDYRARGLPHMPYQFLDTYTSEIYGDPEKMTLLGKFVRVIIVDNIWRYVAGVLAHIPDIFSDVCRVIPLYRQQPLEALHPFFSLLQTFYRTLWYSGYLVFVWFPLSVWMYMRKRNYFHLALVFLAAVSICEMLAIVFLVYHDALEEYARLVTVIQSQTYLFIYLHIYILVQTIRRKRYF